MCWKQEWASAIGNLQSAVTHIERAKAKLEHRREKNLQRLQHHHDKWSVKTILPLVTKNTAGIIECERTIATLRAEQAYLYHMIETYGISVREKNARLIKLMNGYRPPDVKRPRETYTLDRVHLDMKGVKDLVDAMNKGELFAITDAAGVVAYSIGEEHSKRFTDFLGTLGDA